MRAIARWNPARDCWESEAMDLFSGLSDVYSEIFPNSGSMRSGSVFERPTSEPPTDGSASSSSPGLLPTPTATLGTGTVSGADAVQRQVETRNSQGLDVVAVLLPTPKATDGTKGGPNQRGSSGDLTMPSAVHQLLPTPTATSYGSNQSPSAGAAVRPSLNSLAPSLALPVDAPSSSTTSAGSAPAAVAGAAPIPSGDVLLLPTPTTQPTTGNGHARNLGTEAKLLPTPTATDAAGSRGRRRDGTPYGPTSGTTLTDATEGLI